jgi:hypothetical protein
MAQRVKAWNVRVTDDEDEMLRALAHHLGLSVSDVLRQLVRQAHVKVARAEARARITRAARTIEARLAARSGHQLLPPEKRKR